MRSSDWSSDVCSSDLGPNFPADFIGFSTANRFNFSAFNLLLTTSERKSVFTNIDYDVSERVRWKTKFLYNNRQSTNRAAPEPIFLGSDAGTGNPLDRQSVE